MTRKQERVLSRTLWSLYGLLGACGIALLAEALFVPRLPQPFEIQLPTMAAVPSGVSESSKELAQRRFSRRLAGPQAPSNPVKAQETTLENLIKLTGILDFGGKKPTLAVIEATGESKAYRAGDKVGETGVRIKDIKDYVIVEYEKRRYKVTFAAIYELPANSVGKE